MDDKILQAINTLLVIIGTVITIAVNFRRFLADKKKDEQESKKANRDFLGEDLKRSREELDRAYARIEELKKEAEDLRKDKEEDLLLIAKLTGQLKTKEERGK
jgi:hypothetical protein